MAAIFRVRLAPLVALVMLIASCADVTTEASQAGSQSEIEATRAAFVGTAGNMKLLPPRSGIYHAAFPDFGPTEDRVSAERIDRFVSHISGKPIVWAFFSDNWFNGIRFPAREVGEIRSRQVIPFIRMMPRRNWDEGCSDKYYSLDKFISGRFDTELRRYARAARDSGGPLIISFGTEMNGDWFPWTGACNGGGATIGYGSPSLADGPERFRDAYRHIIDIFRNEGADNVTWFMHYNGLSAPTDRWNAHAAYYPGDDYIDWLGLSAYAAQSPSELRRWNPSFRSVMDQGYGSVAKVSSRKPIALLEFGVVDHRGKSAWVRSALADVRSGRYPRLKAISWWHSNWRNRDGSWSRMRLDTSAETLSQYRLAVSDSTFVTRPLIRR